MLLPLVLAAAPVLLPAPVETSLEHCSRAACTQAKDVRVCKCLAPDPQSQDLIVVDRPEERRVIWATASRGETTDFFVQQVDLDADDTPELIIASLMSVSETQAIRSWDVGIIDGLDDVAVRFVAHDVGTDVTKAGVLLVTEWQWRGLEKENALFFIGREYQYASGALVPTKAAVLSRRLTPEFEKERAALLDKRDLLLPGRSFLSSAAAVKGADEPPKRFTLGHVRAVTRDDPEYQVHAEDERSQLVRFSSDGDGAPVFRLGDFKSRRLYPLRYWPNELEGALLGKKALIGLTNGQPSGVVFVQ